jgi:hypothetical protein
VGGGGGGDAGLASLAPILDLGRGKARLLASDHPNQMLNMELDVQTFLGLHVT